jgi:transcription initiation factor IIE alpha subunit
MDFDKDIETLKKLIPSSTGDELFFLVRRLEMLIFRKKEQEREREREHVQINVPPKEKFRRRPIGNRHCNRNNKLNHVTLDDTIPFNLECPRCDQPLVYDSKTVTLSDPIKSVCKCCDDY